MRQRERQRDTEIQRHRERAQDWTWFGLWKPQSLLQVAYLLQQVLIFLPLQNSSTNWGPSIQIYEPMEAILVQTTTGI